MMRDSVKISTYNVLSSSLCEPGFHRSCSVAALDQSNRLIKVKEKLEQEIASKSIICLQEVSHNWAGKLHPFFVNRGYHLVTALYGHRWNGYMGVAIAVPIDEYNIVDVEIARVADTMKHIKKRKQVGNFVSELISKYLVKPFMALMKYWNLLKLPPVNAFSESSYKQNQMISVKLSKKDSTATSVSDDGNTAVVSSLNKEFVQCHRYAAGAPYVVTGDFNVKPDSDMYEMLTSGASTKVPELKDVDNNAEITLKVSPLTSAYKAHQGVEPNMTNWGQTQESPPFIGTLDYIFLSEEWSVAGVSKLPTIEEGLVGPLPTEDEPSDHLLLSADLKL